MTHVSGGLGSVAVAQQALIHHSFHSLSNDSPHNSFSDSNSSTIRGGGEGGGGRGVHEVGGERVSNGVQQRDLERHREAPAAPKEHQADADQQA